MYFQSLGKKLKLLIVGTIFISIIASVFAFNSFEKTDNSKIASAATELNTNFATSTYLGGTLDTDNFGGVAIAPDKTIVWAGRIGGNNFGVTPTNIDGGGNGVVMRLSSNGQSVLSITRVGDYVEDIAVNRTNGNIYANTDAGIYGLNPTGSTKLWSDDFGSATIGQRFNGRKIAIAQDGTIAASVAKEIKVYQPNGTAAGATFFDSGSRVQDITIDSVNQTVFVGGDTQKDGGPCTQLRMAFIHTYSYTGTQKWKGYDWTHAQAAAASSSCPDTEVRYLNMGEDGMLYFQGVSAGGGSIFRYKSGDISQAAPNLQFDQFNNPYNMNGAANITYYARLNPADGEVLKGQHILARLSSGKGNTINPQGITADSNGRMYMLLSSAASFSNRSSITANNLPIGAYNGDEVLLQVSPDFTTREKISILNNGDTVSDTYSSSETRLGSGVAFDFGVQAYAGRTSKANLVFNALQATKASDVDNFLAVIEPNTGSSSSSSVVSSALSSSPAQSSSSPTASSSPIVSSSPVSSSPVISSTSASTAASSTPVSSTPTVSSTVLAIKAYLKGAYSSSTNTMVETLTTNNLIPLAQPYNTPTYNYQGTETVSRDDLVNNNIVDWVLVEIYNTTTSTTPVKRQAALLTKNGNLLDSTSKLVGINLGSTFATGNYQIVLKHSSHLGIKTANPITITKGVIGTITKNSNGTTTVSATNAIDFSSNVNVKNSNQAQLNTGLFGLKQGDVNADGNIDATDRTIVRNFPERVNYYDAKDLNLDGNIDASDRVMMRLTLDSTSGF